MAYARATLKKSVFGNKRVHFGTSTWANADTSGTLVTGLRKVEALIHPGLQAYTLSGGTATLTFADPGASAGTVAWMAIGY